MEEISKMDGINSIEDERIDRFLKLLRSNPEAIESQVLKKEYKELLEMAFEKGKSDCCWAGYMVPELLKLDIIDKNEIKEKYKELLEKTIEEAKSNSYICEYILPGLLKLDIIDKNEIKEKYKELLEKTIEEAKSNSAWLKSVVPKLLKLDIIDKNEIKEKYKELLEIAFESAKLGADDALYTVPELLKLKIIDKNEIDKNDKERYKELYEKAIEEGKSNFYFVAGLIPALILELLRLNIIDKNDKERYNKLLDMAIENARNTIWQHIIPELLKLKIIDKNEITEKCMELLEKRIEKNELSPYLAQDIMPELLKLNISDKNKITKKCMKLLNKAIEKAESKGGWQEYTLRKLLKLKIKAIEKAESKGGWQEYKLGELLKLKIMDKNEIDKNDKERCKELYEKAIEEGKSNCSRIEDILPNLLELKIIDKNDKERYKELLVKAIEKGKGYDSYVPQYIVPELLKLNIIDKNDKERYKELLEKTIEEAKSSYCLAWYVVPGLLRLKIIDKNDKERYKKLLAQALENAKSDSSWARHIVPELIKLNILDKGDKERYKELLEMAMEMAKSKDEWVLYIVPELLKLKIIDKNEINIDTGVVLQNITWIGTSFFENNVDVIDAEDIKFIEKFNDYFTKEEINYLYKQDYEYFKGVEIAVKEKNYQKIWQVKKEFYPQEEKYKLQKMEEYFGEGIGVYFVDKVPGNKLLKNRFRDPHNALLHTYEIIDLAKHLETKGIDKKEFIKNYLGVAGDRNNGYQQLNNFLEKYVKDRKELVKGAINVNEFEGNTDFMNLREGILEQEKTGELYKNLDNFEQILTLLNMIRNKEALIKLQKLVGSENPKDKKLYEYYKGAIYHPRTKPIIMKMYENPEEFLGLDDTTFTDLGRIHQAKKPSNMVENFEFLDFDAKDLVDCLPLGIYDQLSYFKPFEMKFYISGSDVFTKEELQQKIGEFLTGADQKKISVIITKLKKQGDETMWFKEWKANKDEFVKKLLGKYGAEGLINLFVNLGYSEFNKYRDLRLMTAKISPKSDPNNRFNGFNCDSLAEGHGKKVVAMFNPYCTDFCIYEGDQDPKEDNLKVTSRVMLNRAIPENFTTLLNRVKSETTHDIVSVLGDKFEDYKDPSEYVITMDNIEANPNFGRKNELAVRKMYEKFFSEYVRQNPISPNGIPINTSKFYSGTGFNKLRILTDRVPNESLPVFVNAYSDNSASYSLQGKLDAGEQIEKQKKVGIHPLSIEDVVQISYMEGKIYPSSMKDHLGNLQHEITASILNNTLKNRPNLSFAWYNEEGKIGGYILAYQGKMEDGTPGVYISDFAVDEKERGTAGVKMIYYWMQELKKNYPEMPVFTRAREKTSYRMIKALAERQGYEITTDELMQDGGENFHRVVMEPKKEQDIDIS